MIKPSSLKTTKSKLDNVPTYQQFKKIVKVQYETVYKEQGFKLSYAYNAESKKYGFQNWNSMYAYLIKRDKENGICSNCDGTKLVGNGNKQRICQECAKS